MSGANFSGICYSIPDLPVVKHFAHRTENGIAPLTQLCSQGLHAMQRGWLYLLVWSTELPVLVSFWERLLHSAFILTKLFFLLKILYCTKLTACIGCHRLQCILGWCLNVTNVHTFITTGATITTWARICDSQHKNTLNRPLSPELR